MAEAARQEDWPRTVVEFEAWHARQPERWEFIDGQPRLMAPASMKHSIIKANAFHPARCARRHPWHGTGGRATDPDRRNFGDSDVVVTCSAIDLSTPVIAEPVIIVEVMSPSSEADDAGRKWFSYRNVPSLRHYLVLSQDRRVVQVHSRAGDLWRERFVSAGAIELDEPPLRLEVEAIYAATDLAA
jgi:Uma2 family endonuclease